MDQPGSTRPARPASRKPTRKTSKKKQRSRRRRDGFDLSSFDWSEIEWKAVAIGVVTGYIVSAAAGLVVGFELFGKATDAGSRDAFEEIILELLQQPGFAYKMLLAEAIATIAGGYAVARAGSFLRKTDRVMHVVIFAAISMLLNLVSSTTMSMYKPALVLLFVLAIPLGLVGAAIHRE